MIETPAQFTNGFSQCVGLIFSSNACYLTTGIEQSIHNKYHHNMIYGKLNCDISVPPTYYRKMWEYRTTYLSL